MTEMAVWHVVKAAFLTKVCFYLGAQVCLSTELADIWGGEGEK